MAGWILYDCFPIKLVGVGSVVKIDLPCGWVFHGARDKAASALRA